MKTIHSFSGVPVSSHSTAHPHKQPKSLWCIVHSSTFFLETPLTNHLSRSKRRQWMEDILTESEDLPQFALTTPPRSVPHRSCQTNRTDLAHRLDHVRWVVACRPGRPGRPPGFSSDDAPGTRRTGLVRAVCGKSAGSNGHTGCAADWLFAAIKTGVPTSPNMWNAKNGTQQLPV